MNKILILAFAAFAGLAIRADVMNWMVNTGDPNSTYNAAQLMVVDGNTTSGGTSIAATSIANGLGVEQQIDVSAYSANASSTYFYIELGNYSAESGFVKAQVAGAYSYAELLQAGMISTGGLGGSTSAGASFGISGQTINGKTVAYAVPEPGTATLILLGIAIAGLKRRRV